MRHPYHFEYGLRSYETSQRILWLLFLLLCFAAAYPLAQFYKIAHSAARQGIPVSIQPESFKSLSLWTHQYWVFEEPLGWLIVYLACVALIFWVGRFLWLILQYGARQLVGGWLRQAVGKTSFPSTSSLVHPASKSSRDTDVTGQFQEAFSPLENLQKKVRTIPFGFLFHPYIRLRLMLSSPRENLSSEELLDKERRASETDWQLFSSSWQPFQWLVWLLPLFGLLQTGWIFYQEVNPVLEGEKEIMEIVNIFLISLLPLIQIVLLTILFNIVAGISKHLETLYLFNIEALFYDQLLSRLPLHSGDTVLVVKALKQHFQQIQQTLRRIEKSLNIDNPQPPQEKQTKSS